MQKYSIRSSCRLCGSSDLDMVLDMGHSPVGEDFIFPEEHNKKQDVYPLVLMRCTACNNMQLSGVVDKKNIYTEYLYESTRSLGLNEHFENYADSLCALPDVQKGQWAIDIGSNVGTLLSALQRRGMRVQGVEPAKSIAATANAQGVQTECCYFGRDFVQDFLRRHEAATLITANNVFANIDDLDTFLSAASLLLAPDGYFVMETGYGLDLLQNFVVDNIFHEHLSYFLLEPLLSFFLKHDLRIVRADRVPTKGGSLRVYARHAQKAPASDWSVTGLVSLEREMLDKPALYCSEFQKQALRHKDEIRAMAHERAKQGALAAFGAAVGCTTLLYWLELADMLSFIVDDNPVMHGRISPRAHLPVCHPDTLLEKMPPTLVNLPWRYIRPIAQRRQDYLQQGGKILQILPHARLI